MKKGGEQRTEIMERTKTEKASEPLGRRGKKQRKVGEGDITTKIEKKSMRKREKSGNNRGKKRHRRSKGR